MDTEPSASPGPDQDQLAELAKLISANRNAEAEPLARTIVETWPLHGAGWKLLGMVLKALGRLDETIPVLHEALERLPGDAETHNTLGSALQGVRRLAESEASYRRAIELEPDYHEACNNLGNTVRRTRLLLQDSAQRIGAKIMNNLELGDRVTADEEAYVQKAVAFGGDLKWLVELHRGMDERVGACAWRDEAGYVRALERERREM